MAEKTYPHEYRRRAAGTRTQTPGMPAWPPRELTAMWLGVPWINFYFKFWNRWLEQLNRGSGTARRDRELNDDRRREAVPWMPQFEATVIPLRRSTDTGTEAARLSMRMSMPSLPWAPGAGNVISIDTLLPRPTVDDDALEKPDDKPGRQPIRKP